MSAGLIGILGLLVIWLVNVLKTPEVIKNAEGDPYLVRYFLYRAKSKNGGRIYLHHIIRSDYDRALHDHPWNFVSFMLWGSYTEYADERQVPKNQIADALSGSVFKAWVPSLDNDGQMLRIFNAPCIIRRGAGWRHRLVILPEQSAWTLVFVGPKVRDWGFWTGRDKWCWWRNYDYRRGICEEGMEVEV